MASISSLSRLTSAATSSAASDVVRHDELTTGSSALIDGGAPSTSASGVLKIDFGAVT
jgi:hypothetical protein